MWTRSLTIASVSTLVVTVLVVTVPVVTVPVVTVPAVAVPAATGRPPSVAATRSASASPASAGLATTGTVGRRGVLAQPGSRTATGSESATTRHSGRYRAPLLGSLRVVRRFEPPPTPYAAGHRGVDLATGPGQVVVAPRDGRVTFAGNVAGRGLVVVAHLDGIATEYEPVTPLVRAGASVRAGQAIAVVRGTHHGCAPGACLHWGARRGTVYLDPLRLLSPLGPVRLLPWDT